ncbi:hypothetical protein [Flavobacterium sp. TSSA_36]|uniref:hypothetical protein n=1 Tax=Flavobacterium sp. TSSA_36 TaxID=3447669 RepID=UPI003F353472
MGVSIAVLVPSSTNDFLGTKKFRVGPIIVFLNEPYGWTYSFLTNKTWSVFRDKELLDVHQLYV